MTPCDRCKQLTNTTQMSYFNTEALCMDCADKERAHPKFKEARDAEHGIGLPDDLRVGK